MPGSKRFEGKTAFITGAASGIGRATAVAFAAEGARVVVTDRGEAALQETAERVKAVGGDALAIICDVSKPEEVEAAVAKAVKTFGRSALRECGLTSSRCLKTEPEPYPIATTKATKQPMPQQVETWSASRSLLSGGAPRRPGGSQ